MRVLLIKTSSMGDIIHTLPALSDASKAIPNLKFDWVVEDVFADIPRWHASVDRIIPVALRRWRKSILASQTRQEWQQLREQLNAKHYDLILDAQGLVKSAFIAFFAKGLRVGLDWPSARESLASLVYQHKCKVNFYQHAIVRMRSLFNKALYYPLPSTKADFGLNKDNFATITSSEKYIVFLHGTTWESKQWPEEYWGRLAKKLIADGYKIKISGNHEEEIARAQRIGALSGDIEVLPGLNITQMARLLANAQAAVAVDTGLGHLAAALSIPTISLYGSTNPDYTGALGNVSHHLKANFPCSPCYKRHCNYKPAAEVTPACYATVTPERVWMEINKVVSRA